MDSKVNESPYRWWILLLGTLTNVLVVAAPSMCMSVLFDEISRDLNLNLVQVGLIWGITALPGIVTVLLGGMISDRFGPRRVILVGCLWVGITGALRGLSVNFATLAATMMLVGVFTGFMTMNSLKACGIWFPRRQLGLASGVLSMGMALGFLIGSLFSATILSPWLGNWRNVLYFYGAISVLMTIPWYFSRSAPGKQGAHIITSPISFRQTIGDVARIRNVWLYGLAIFGIGGCIQGALGYLPLYLRGMGWQPVSADGALSAFHMVSMLFCIPIALWSDRLGTRKKVLVGAALMVAAGVGLLSVVQGPARLDRRFDGRFGAGWIYGCLYDRHPRDRRGRRKICGHRHRHCDGLFGRGQPARPAAGQQPGCHCSRAAVCLLGRADRPWIGWPAAHPGKTFAGRPGCRGLKLL